MTCAYLLDAAVCAPRQIKW